MNFATVIQKNWRGYNTRKVYASAPDEKDATTPEGPSSKPLVNVPPIPATVLSPPSRETTYSEDSMAQENSAIPRRLSSHFPFNRQYNVDIRIDGIVGLPITSTATRLKVRMMMPTRDVVGETPYEYCDLASDHTSPSFNLKYSWKAKSLHPTVTVVCQVETLESLSLLPRVIGIAVLRLCVDNVGLQPISEVILDDRPSCYFNAGQFAVPLLYGVISDDFQFVTEAKVQELLPHIDGAFVRLSLTASKPGDYVVVDQPFPIDLRSESGFVASMKHAVDEQGGNTDTVNFTSTTITSTLLRTHIAISHHLHTKGITGMQSAPTSGLRAFIRPSSASYSRPSTAGSNGGGGGGILGSSGGTANSASAANVFNTLKLSIPAMVLTKFQQGESIVDGERTALLSDMQQYILRSFEASHTQASHGFSGAIAEMNIHTAILHGISMHSHSNAQKNQNQNPPTLINPFYLSTFMRQPGSLVGLDMLHNMPERIGLIEAAEEAAAMAAAESGLEKEWEDRIICFKTVFRYLPGIVFDGDGEYEQQVFRSLREQTEMEKARNMSFRSTGPMAEGQQVIIDDASVKPYLPSSELNPGYLDDYSSTAGLRLGPFACVLVVVTAVDVLTRAPPQEMSTGSDAQILQIHGIDGTDSQDDGEQIDVQRQGSQDAGASARGGVSGKSLGSLAFSDRTAPIAPPKHLRGLLGVYVGHGDPRATWWGIVPLFRTLPSYVLASMPSKYSPHFKAPVGLQTIQASPSSGGSPTPKGFGRTASLLGPLLSPKGGNRSTAPLPSPNSTTATPTTPVHGRASAPGLGSSPGANEQVRREQSSAHPLALSESVHQFSPAVDLVAPTSSPPPPSRGGRFRRGFGGGANSSNGGDGNGNSPNKVSPPMTIDTALSASLSVSGIVHSPQTLLTNLSQVASWPLYVNQGSHQIPLFEGLPPEELIQAPDPMLWLLRQLDKQLSAQSYLSSSAASFASSASLQRAASSSLSFLLSPLASFFNGTATPSTRRKSTRKKKRKQSKQPEELSIILSPGSSVLVRLANPRMKKLAPLPIIDSRDKVVFKSLLDNLLKILAQQPGRTGGGLGSMGSGSASLTSDNGEDAAALINPDLQRLLQDLPVDMAKMKMLRQRFQFVNAVSLFSPTGVAAQPFHHSLGGGIIYTGSPSGAANGRPMTAQGRPSTAQGRPSTAQGRPSTAQYRPTVIRRTLEQLMSSDGLNPQDLVVFINQKFYETLST